MGDITDQIGSLFDKATNTKKKKNCDVEKSEELSLNISMSIKENNQYIKCYANEKYNETLLIFGN